MRLKFRHMHEVEFASDGCLANAQQSEQTGHRLRQFRAVGMQAPAETRIGISGASAFADSRSTILDSPDNGTLAVLWDQAPEQGRQCDKSAFHLFEGNDFDAMDLDVAWEAPEG